MTFDGRGNYTDDCEDGMALAADPQPECRIDECEQCGEHVPGMEGCTGPVGGLFCSPECMKEFWVGIFRGVFGKARQGYLFGRATHDI